MVSVFRANMDPMDYKPSGLSQILAASGLSGDALFGSETGIR